jgi:sigma-E factor negative regulatory protein RseC
MGSAIEHEGVVTRVTGESVTVIVKSGAACEGCRARGACGQPGSKTREIVTRHPGRSVTVGERVTVRVSGGNAARSVLLAHVLPSAMIIALVALLSPRTEEIVVAVVALVAVAAYFFLIFLCRDILARKITFTIASP